MSNKITFDELCKSCDIILPKVIIDALEAKYTPEECIELLSKINLSNDNLKIIDTNLIDKYIKSKKNSLIRFR